MSNSCFSRVFTPRKSFTQKSNKKLKNAKKFRLGAESNFCHETSSLTFSLCATQPSVMITMNIIYILDFFYYENCELFLEAGLTPGDELGNFSHVTWV